MNDQSTEPWTCRHPRARHVCIAVLVVPFAYAFLKLQLVRAGVNLGPFTVFDRILIGLTPMLIATAGIVEWWDRRRNRILFVGVMLLGGIIASAGMLYDMFK